MIRQGTCNNCGECCGTSGDSPFPINWPSAIRFWNLEDVEAVCPQLAVFGMRLANGELGFDTDHFLIRIRNKRFYVVMPATGGIMKDTSVAHDGSSYNSECPFLMDDPGDGSRPCGLVGEAFEGARQVFCRPEERPVPPPDYDNWDQRMVDQWQDDHPNCSYVFVEV